MQANLEDFIHGAELQFGQEPPGELFGVVGEAAFRHAGDAAQRAVQFIDAKADGAREMIAEEKKFRHAARMHVGAVDGFVGVPRAARAQHGGPAQRLVRADALRQAARRQALVAHVEDARGLVGALQKLAGLHEPPTLVVDERGVDDADDVERAGFDFLEKFRRAASPDFVRLRRADEQVKAVQLLPKFQRDLVAHHAGVFARLADGLDERIRILPVEDKKLRDRRAGGVRVRLKKRLLVAGGEHDGFPVGDELLLIEAAHVEEQLQVHVHEARNVFGALDVAGHPIQ